MTRVLTFLAASLVCTVAQAAPAAKGARLACQGAGEGVALNVSGSFDASGKATSGLTIEAVSETGGKSVTVPAAHVSRIDPDGAIQVTATALVGGKKVNALTMLWSGYGNKNSYATANLKALGLKVGTLTTLNVKRALRCNGK